MSDVADSHAEPTWNSIFVRSRGDTHVLDTVPATPPAARFFKWLRETPLHGVHCDVSRVTAGEWWGGGERIKRGREGRGKQDKRDR